MDHRIAYLFLDAIVVPVKLDHRSHQMAVLVALGVHESGERELLGIKPLPALVCVVTADRFAECHRTPT